MMGAFGNAAGVFFAWLLDTTLAASVAICLILLLQRLLGRRLGPRWSHALWLVLLVRMILPWTPPSPVGLSGLVPARFQREVYRVMTDPLPHEGSHGPSNRAVLAPQAPPPTPETSESSDGPAALRPQEPLRAENAPAPPAMALRGMLFLLWLAGAVLLAAWLFASNFALWRTVKREHPLVNQPILELFERCKSEMGVETIVAVVPSDRARIAALFGFIRPRLLLPHEMIQTTGPEELRYIFLHELGHLKRHDIWIGWLTSVVQILHWFNPLVWLAFHRMRTDRELACDALVLARTGRDESHEYGRTMVSLLDRVSQSRRLPAMAGILESKSQLKRRIAMIAGSERVAYKMTPLAITLLIVLGCASVPGPKQENTSIASKEKSPAGMTLRRLQEEWGGFANISPDGRYLCDVADWDDGNLTICDLTTGKRWPVTANAKDESVNHYALDAAISPDSQKVAYLWYEEKTAASSLWLAGRDGSGRRLLCEGKYIMPKDWSADGTKILAAIYGEPHQMAWISASDGSIQKIKDVGKEYPGKFDVSPDGRFIAYDQPQADDTTKRDVFLYDIAGGRDIGLIESPADDMLLGWTPDGKSIFFSSDRTGVWDGWLLDVQDGKPAGIPQRVKPAMGKVEPIGFRSNGDYYFAVYGISGSVYTASFDPATGSTALPLSPVRQRVSLNYPDWSPDGKYLAYCDIKKENDPAVICIRSVATGEEREIEPKLPLVSDLCWAPDGRSFLVSGSADRNRSHVMVYQVDAQTGNRTELIPSKNTRFIIVRWLPDEKRLVCYRLPGDEDTTVPRIASLTVRDMDTGKERELARAEIPDRLSSWALSPDGRWIAIETWRVTGGSVNLISVESGQTRELLGRDWAEKICTVASWSPDGNYVLLLVRPERSAKPPITELWRVAASGGEPEKVQTFRQVPLVRMRIHPDGRHVALVTHEGLDEMWVMENFLPRVENAK